MHLQYWHTVVNLSLHLQYKPKWSQLDINPSVLTRRYQIYIVTLRCPFRTNKRLIHLPFSTDKRLLHLPCPFRTDKRLLHLYCPFSTDSLTLYMYFQCWLGVIILTLHLQQWLKDLPIYHCISVLTKTFSIEHCSFHVQYYPNGVNFTLHLPFTAQRVPT